MKKFISILAFLGLLSVASASPIYAAPDATISLTTDKRYVVMKFSDLKSVSKVGYTLTYYSGSQQKGFAGGFKNSARTQRTTKRQILGTCSSGKCVFHRNIKDVNLEVTFTTRSGQKTTITKNLP